MSLTVVFVTCRARDTAASSSPSKVIADPRIVSPSHATARSHMSANAVIPDLIASFP
jgi:hypothetical protein